MIQSCGRLLKTFGLYMERLVKGWIWSSAETLKSFAMLLILKLKSYIS